MDLKGIGKPINPLPVQTGERVGRSINSEKTTDREGNGQSAGGGNGEQHPPMTDEQFENVMEHLKKLQAVKDHLLEVVEYRSGDRRFILLREPGGKVVRRIPESELWSLQTANDNDRGQLLRKSV